MGQTDGPTVEKSSFLDPPTYRRIKVDNQMYHSTVRCSDRRAAGLCPRRLVRRSVQNRSFRDMPPYQPRTFEYPILHYPLFAASSASTSRRKMTTGSGPHIGRREKVFIFENFSARTKIHFENFSKKFKKDTSPIGAQTGLRHEADAEAVSARRDDKPSGMEVILTPPKKTLHQSEPKRASPQEGGITGCYLAPTQRTPI